MVCPNGLYRKKPGPGPRTPDPHPRPPAPPYINAPRMQGTFHLQQLTMFKRVYSHVLIVLTLVCYIINFVKLGTAYEKRTAHEFGFGITLSVIHCFSILFDLVDVAYYIEAGTTEDVRARQHIVLVAIYTILFTVAINVIHLYLFIVSFLSQVVVTLHRVENGVSDIEGILLDIVLCIVWIVFLVELSESSKLVI